MEQSPIVLFTDYGYAGPYVGLLHAIVRGAQPQAAIIDLQHDLPPFRPRGAGILLAAQLRWLPRGSIVVAVVDPGVGTPRQGLMLRFQGHSLVAPDNGLLAPFLRQAEAIRVIDWSPRDIPATFHGRDWFVPVAMRIAKHEPVASHAVAPADCVGFEYESNLPEVVYVDRFGNLVTGLSGDVVDQKEPLRIGGHVLQHARTFAEVAPGAAFWHVNSLGLVELAVNRGSASTLLGLVVGDRISG